MKVLILGGTSESRSLAATLDGRFDTVTSLAGRVRDPLLPDGEVRIGGFGGAEGLASWIRAHAVDAVVDATHPFAEEMSWNAAWASAQTSTPLAVLRRRPWLPEVGDIWIDAESVSDAASMVRAMSRERQQRVFLTIGRQGVGAFADDDSSWFLVRSIDAPDAPMPLHHETLLARGPFDVRDERELMRSRRVDVVVSKNSGGAMTEAKLRAARELGLPVVMIARPRLPQVDVVTDSVSDVAAWLEARLRTPGTDGA